MLETVTEYSPALELLCSLSKHQRSEVELCKELNISIRELGAAFAGLRLQGFAVQRFAGKMFIESSGINSAERAASEYFKGRHGY